MKAINIDQILEEMRLALERDDHNAALGIIESLRSPDQAQVFTELDDEYKVVLLPQLDPAKSADLLEELEDGEAADLVAALPTDTAIRIADEMEPDELADLLEAVPPQYAQIILTGLEDPEEIHPLLIHPSDSAGGLMTSEYLVLRRRMTAADAIQAIHEWKPGDETIYYLFVVNQHGQLCGVVSLRHIIVAEPDSLIRDIMNPDVISVPVGTDQEDCAQIMSHYDLLSLPVVDEMNVLLGVITIDDVMDVLEEEVTEDIQRLGGAQPLDQPYLRTGIFTVSRKRIGWLLLLFITESLTGTVLRHFSDELQAQVALAFFVPLLIGTGGNAGSQTTSTLIRALAVGDIRLGDALRTWWHELRVGIILGIGMGIIAFMRAMIWGTGTSLALTVALAIFTIVVWANGLGAVLPLLAARLRMDPTIVSGPVMSTLVDATGLFIYFSVARVILRI